jgi:hypothetical protein
MRQPRAVSRSDGREQGGKADPFRLDLLIVPALPIRVLEQEMLSLLETPIEALLSYQPCLAGIHCLVLRSKV